MMLQKISPVIVLSALQKQVQNGTGMICYDAVPENAPSPFYYMRITRIQPANTKTMFVDRFDITIHSVAKPTDSSVPVLGMVEALETALTQRIGLPHPYHLYNVISNGTQNLMQDETGEWHAVNTYSVYVSYGFRCKA